MHDVLGVVVFHCGLPMSEDVEEHKKGKLCINSRLSVGSPGEIRTLSHVDLGEEADLNPSRC